MNDDCPDPIGALYALALRGLDPGGPDAALAGALVAQARAHEASVEAERDRAISRRDHTTQWYAVRLERLKDLGKERGIWPEMAAIVANGSASAFDPPTYAQQLNAALHRAASAERRAQDAEALAATLRRRLDEAGLGIP